MCGRLTTTRSGGGMRLAISSVINPSTQHIDVGSTSVACDIEISILAPVLNTYGSEER